VRPADLTFRVLKLRWQGHDLHARGRWRTRACPAAAARLAAPVCPGMRPSARPRVSVREAWRGHGGPPGPVWCCGAPWGPFPGRGGVARVNACTRARAHACTRGRAPRRRVSRVRDGPAAEGVLLVLADGVGARGVSVRRMSTRAGRTPARSLKSRPSSRRGEFFFTARAGPGRWAPRRARGVRVRGGELPSGRPGPYAAWCPRHTRRHVARRRKLMVVPGPVLRETMITCVSDAIAHFE
jgi:hypothetical protein